MDGGDYNIPFAFLKKRGKSVGIIIIIIIIIIITIIKSIRVSGGGGGTLIFSHIRRLGPFFGVQNSEFQYFFWFSEK